MQTVIQQGTADQGQLRPTDDDSCELCLLQYEPVRSPDFAELANNASQHSQLTVIALSCAGQHGPTRDTGSSIGTWHQDHDLSSS